MTLLLSVQDLSKSYGHRPLFVGLSLELRAGDRLDAEHTKACDPERRSAVPVDGISTRGGAAQRTARRHRSCFQ